MQQRWPILGAQAGQEVRAGLGQHQGLHELGNGGHAPRQHESAPQDLPQCLFRWGSGLPGGHSHRPEPALDRLPPAKPQGQQDRGFKARAEVDDRRGFGAGVAAVQGERPQLSQLSFDCQGQAGGAAPGVDPPH